MKTNLPIKPFETEKAPGIVHNVLQVRVDYDKSVKGPIMWLQTGQKDAAEPGSVFTSFKCALFGSPSARVVLDRGWTRNDKKKMAAVEESVLVAVATKSGSAFESILAVLAEGGSELVASGDAAVSAA